MPPVLRLIFLFIVIFMISIIGEMAGRRLARRRWGSFTVLTALLFPLTFCSIILLYD